MFHDLTLPEGTILLPLAIKALYSSIPLERGLQVIEKLLRSRAMSKHKHSDFIIKLLRFLLTHNKFKFNSTWGTRYSHGYKMCPSICKRIFGSLADMAICREDIACVPVQDIILSQVHHQRPCLVDCGTGGDWGPYEGTDGKFTSEWHRERVTFLDLTVELIGQHTVKTTCGIGGYLASV